jgi:hypothetical protein
MAKLQPLDTRPLGGGQSWARTNGTYIAGRAYLDEADLTASQMEAKWGADRLRLLVGPELREKFDRQRYLFNQAIWHGDLEAVRRESMRMVKGWLALDAAATAAGKERLSPMVWEVPLGSDLGLAAIVPSDEHAAAVRAEGRQVTVYTLEEIARFLVVYPELARAKAKFPGAEVVAVRKSVDDPLNAIADSDAPLDDPIPDLGA